MLNVSRNKDTGELQSTLACYVCRRRKIRCGRELPRCLVCEETLQACEYPQRVSKPGPKIGTTRKSHARQRQDSNSIDASRSSCAVVNEDTFDLQCAPSSPPQPPTSTASGGERSRPIHSLSFIMHPSHESCASDTDSAAPPATNTLPDHESPLADTYNALSITPHDLGMLIDDYFTKFTSFQLFRRPQFRDKLQAITKPAQVNALLAAMLAFASIVSDSQNYLSTPSSQPLHEHFSELALRNMDEALRDYDDGAPPLCVLQALILITHWLLIQRVRGRAWRYLGTCIRIAYELNLHLVDANRTPSSDVSDADQWCEDEERRRAWWAIWEMDVFASVIKRCPVGINAQQNKTFLPAEDERWFQGLPQRSCLLEPGLIERWKTLQASGNQSPKAWFIVVNSLMQEAQTISSPVGLNKDPTVTRGDNENADCRAAREHYNEGKSRLATIFNSLRCFTLALPAALKYRNQYLNFSAQTANGQYHSSPPLQLHSSLYSIHLMTQLTKLMINHFHVFGGAARSARLTAERSSIRDAEEGHPESHSPLDAPQTYAGNDKSAEQYFEAADEILTIVNRSADDHYIYVNPFLANTIWLAAAVQLVHKESNQSGTRELKQSNFEVLHMVHKSFVNFWNMSTVMQQNLDRLELQLQQFRGGPQDPNEKQPDLDPTARAGNSRWIREGGIIERDGASHDRRRNTPLRSLPYNQTFYPSEVPHGTHTHGNGTTNSSSSQVGVDVARPSEIQFGRNTSRQGLQLSQKQGQDVEPYMGLLSPSLSTFSTVVLQDPPNNSVLHNPGSGNTASCPAEPIQSMMPFTSCSYPHAMSTDFMDGLLSSFQGQGSSGDGARLELTDFLDNLLSGSCLE